MYYNIIWTFVSNFRFGFFEVLKPLVAAVLTAEYVNLEDLRDIRRMNPSCAIKNIYHLVTPDFNRGACKPTKHIYLLFKKHHINTYKM